MLIPRAKRAEKISAFLHLNYNDFKLKWLIFRARDKILAFLHLKHKDFRGKLLIPRAKRAKKILAGTLTRSGGCRLGPARLFRGHAYQVGRLLAGSGTLNLAKFRHANKKYACKRMHSKHLTFNRLNLNTGFSLLTTRNKHNVYPL